MAHLRIFPIACSVILQLRQISAFSSLISSHTHQERVNRSRLMSTGYGMPTELPDSLDDSAVLAAQGCADFFQDAGSMARCRVDFDTSVGDETYTTLKSSTQFMQKFVTALCYEMIPGVKEMREKEMFALANAKIELKQLMEKEGMSSLENQEEDMSVGDDDEGKEKKAASNPRFDKLKLIIQNGGREPNNDSSTPLWTGPKARVYFPDEGSAALARRDWNPSAANPEDSLVPPCVEFSSCGGVQLQDISNDELIFFFCPKASEAEFVEEVLSRSEDMLGDQLKLTVFVNPLLVDMGVTGFGMAGRMLRERLIDRLVQTYYLRTLPWGALTRLYPRQFTVWQEDENAQDGYRMIKSMDRLPSNPEVEDIYDIENGIANDPEKAKGFGFLDALGDFVNGMTKL